MIYTGKHLVFGLRGPKSYETPDSLSFCMCKVPGMGRGKIEKILSEMGEQGLRRCAMKQDIEALSRMEGIGRKLAERLIEALSDNIEKEFAKSPVSALLNNSVQEATETLEKLVDSKPLVAMNLCAYALADIATTHADKISHRKAFATAARKALKQLEKGPKS